MKKVSIFLGILSVISAGCGTITSATSPTPTSHATDGKLTAPILQNTEYHSPDWGNFQLVDGIYYRTPPTTGESPQLYSTQLTDSIAYGDLNADGLEDAAVILRTYNGGNGNFPELAAVLNLNGKADNVSIVAFGSEIAVEKFYITAGVIVLDMHVRRSNDNQLVTWKFRLVNNQLIQLP